MKLSEILAALFNIAVVGDFIHPLKFQRKTTTFWELAQLQSSAENTHASGFDRRG
jgi:hypothetical protein